MTHEGWVVWPVWKKAAIVAGLIALCIGIYLSGGRAGPEDTVRREVRQADASVQWKDIDVRAAGSIRDANGVSGWDIKLMCGGIASTPGRQLAAVVSEGRRGRPAHLRELALSWDPQATAREQWLLAECSRRPG